MIHLKGKSIVLLGVFIIPLAIILAAVPNSKTMKKQVDQKLVLAEITQGIHYLSAQDAADYIVNKDPSIVFVDVRSQEAYDEFHLPAAFNVPLVSMTDKENLEFFDQPGIMFVLYSNGTVDANQAYTVARMSGFDNLYVLDGGLNAWGDTIVNMKKPAASASGDEIAKYNFSKGAAQATGTGAEQTEQKNEAPSNKPAFKKRVKKKRVAGGC